MYQLREGLLLTGQHHFEVLVAKLEGIQRVADVGFCEVNRRLDILNGSTARHSGQIENILVWQAGSDAASSVSAADRVELWEAIRRLQQHSEGQTETIAKVRGAGHLAGQIFSFLAGILGTVVGAWIILQMK